MAKVILRLDVIEAASGQVALGQAFGQIAGTVEVTYDRTVTITGAGQAFAQLPRVFNLPASGFLDLPMVTSDDASITAGSGFVTTLTFKLRQRALPPTTETIGESIQLKVTSASPAAIPVGANDPVTGQLATVPVLLLSQQPRYVPPPTGGGSTGNYSEGHGPPPTDGQDGDVYRDLDTNTFYGFDS